MRSKFILIFVLFVGLLNAGSALQKEKARPHQPFIILLNGTSSAGKSSIARELQNLIQPSLHVGFDHYSIMLSPEYFFGGTHTKEGFYLDMDPDHPEKIRGVKAGPVGEQLITAMQQSMKALIDNQFTLIIDELLFDDFSFHGYLKVFFGYPVYFIAVKPPIEVVRQREIDRGDRVIGVGEVLYEPTYGHKIYDLEIDSSALTPRQSAEKILDYIQKHPHPEAFSQNKS